MSLSKKIKNREKSKKNHKNHKALKTYSKVRNVINNYDEYVADRVFDGLNRARMRTCYIQSVYAFYVCHKDFKFPWKEMNTLFRHVAKCATMYTEHLADANDAIDCLEDECGFVYPQLESLEYKVEDILKIPEGEERDRFIQLVIDSHRRTHIIEARIRFETQILMVLHDKYGFGKKRLDRFVKTLREYYDMPEETYEAMLNYLNERANMGLNGYKAIADKVESDLKKGVGEDHSLRPVGRFFQALREGRVS